MPMMVPGPMVVKRGAGPGYGTCQYRTAGPGVKRSVVVLQRDLTE